MHVRYKVASPGATLYKSGMKERKGGKRRGMIRNPKLPAQSFVFSEIGMITYPQLGYSNRGLHGQGGHRWVPSQVRNDSTVGSKVSVARRTMGLRAISVARPCERSNGTMLATKMPIVPVANH